MRIATYNVLANAYVRREFYVGVAEGLFDRNRRRAALLDRVARLDAAIVCLQEVEEDCAQDFEKRLGPSGYVGTWRPKAKKPDGLATLVKGVALASVEAHYYEDGTGHLALITHLRANERDLLVANTHLRWADPDAPRESRACAVQADSLARVLGARPGDAVVCGDLNVTASDDALQSLFACGFRDVFAGADEPHTCLSSGRTQKIDHVLVRGDFSTVAYRSPSARGVARMPNEDEPSDHLPLVAELAWP